MKNTIILILQIIILGIVSSCEKNEEGITFVDFSDNVFYEWCLSSFDLDGDQELSFRELYLVTEMNIPAQYNGQTIKSLGVIENFTTAFKTKSPKYKKAEHLFRHSAFPILY